MRLLLISSAVLLSHAARAATAAVAAPEQLWQGKMRAGAGGLERADSSNVVVLACYLGDLLGPLSVGPVGPLYTRMFPCHGIASSQPHVQ
jgi:hypothetical protein